MTTHDENHIEDSGNLYPISSIIVKYEEVYIFKILKMNTQTPENRQISHLKQAKL